MDRQYLTGTIGLIVLGFTLIIMSDKEPISLCSSCENAKHTIEDKSAYWIIEGKMFSTFTTVSFCNLVEYEVDFTTKCSHYKLEAQRGITITESNE